MHVNMIENQSLKIIKAPLYQELEPNRISVFLGGSIEAGTAHDWQNDVIKQLNNNDYSANLDILNPRRDAWDASWPVDNPHHPQLREQISWELHYQECADILIYYFAANTLSPITLLELGTYAYRKPIIYTQPGYQRLANVQITAEKYGWDDYDDLDQFYHALDARIRMKLAETSRYSGE